MKQNMVLWFVLVACCGCAYGMEQGKPENIAPVLINQSQQKNLVDAQKQQEELDDFWYENRLVQGNQEAREEHQLYLQWKKTEGKGLTNSQILKAWFAKREQEKSKNESLKQISKSSTK